MTSQFGATLAIVQVLFTYWDSTVNSDRIIFAVVLLVSQATI